MHSRFDKARNEIENVSALFILSNFLSIFYTCIISIFIGSTTYRFTLNIKLTNGWVRIPTTVNRLES